MKDALCDIHHLADAAEVTWKAVRADAQKSVRRSWVRRSAIGRNLHAGMRRLITISHVRAGGCLQDLPVHMASFGQGKQSPRSTPLPPPPKKHLRELHDAVLNQKVLTRSVESVRLFRIVSVPGTTQSEAIT
jgi:hypothetical protein